MNEEKISRQNELLDINKQQAKFYDAPPSDRKLNMIMKVWRVLRRRMYFLMNNGIWTDVYSLQKAWIGDLSGKKVLDLGCYDGNALSGYLAANAASYLGVDLSSPALNRLAQHFKDKGINEAKLKCIDVLSSDFTDSDFDIIYAQGVLHHFNPIGVVLPVLFNKLSPDGKIVSLDPLQTSLLTRSVRAIYHPFRSDKEWEWPFTQNTISTIKQHFVIKHIQGVVGCSKWAIPIAFVNKALAVRFAKFLHARDLVRAGIEGKALWGCLQVVMCLEKRTESVIPVTGK